MKKKLISDSVRITFYCNTHQEYPRFFSLEKNLLYCIEIAQLLHKIGLVQCELKGWQLFIDSSKRSPKSVLRHNGNQFTSLRFCHLTSLKEKNKAMKHVLEKIYYDQHEWFIGIEPKIRNILLGQKSEFIKYPYFLCMWVSRDTDQHYTKKAWILVYGEAFTQWSVKQGNCCWEEARCVELPSKQRDWEVFELIQPYGHSMASFGCRFLSYWH